MKQLCGWGMLTSMEHHELGVVCLFVPFLLQVKLNYRIAIHVHAYMLGFEIVSMKKKTADVIFWRITFKETTHVPACGRSVK